MGFINKPEFEKLEGVFSAVKEIDRILLNNTDDTFEMVLTAIKDIDKKSLDKDIIKDRVIGGIREALVKIYKEGFIETNLNIGINTTFGEDIPVGESVCINKGAATGTSYLTTNNTDVKDYRKIDEEEAKSLIDLNKDNN